jgi:hypothetical protein
VSDDTIAAIATAAGVGGVGIAAVILGVPHEHIYLRLSVHDQDGDLVTAVRQPGARRARGHRCCDVRDWLATQPGALMQDHGKRLLLAMALALGVMLAFNARRSRLVLVIAQELAIWSRNTTRLDWLEREDPMTSRASSQCQRTTDIGLSDAAERDPPNTPSWYGREIEQVVALPPRLHVLSAGIAEAAREVLEETPRQVTSIGASREPVRVGGPADRHRPAVLVAADAGWSLSTRPASSWSPLVSRPTIQLASASSRHCRADAGTSVIESRPYGERIQPTRSSQV